MGFFATILTTPARFKGIGRSNGVQISKKLIDSASADCAAALAAWIPA